MKSEEVGSKPGSENQADEKLLALDFSTFVLSLSTTALYQMGRVPDPETGAKIEPNRVIAQQTIDTIEMLREKTRGNLEPDEAKLIDSLLYELRLQFVEPAD
ncbi:MAG: hypothetical protein CL917_12685 [Deltaproteobacteria bacterium]|nr:hypothetical protein [Deltaproteobacteria bacterium]